MTVAREPKQCFLDSGLSWEISGGTWESSGGIWAPEVDWKENVPKPLCFSVKSGATDHFA